MGISLPAARNSQSDLQEFDLEITGGTTPVIAFGGRDVASITRTGAGDYSITLKNPYARKLMAYPQVRSDAGNLFAVVHDTGTTNQIVRIRIATVTGTPVATDANLFVRIIAKRGTLEL